MSDQNTSRQEPPPPTPSPIRRERAPTITIDTSAVSPSLAPPSTRSSQDSARPSRPQHSRKLSTGDHQGEGSSPVGVSPSDIQPTHSFELRDSRPTSPHNVSSPTRSNNQLQAFLSVPSTRSRGNSVDSDDMAPSPTSYGGETYLPSENGSSHVGDERSRLDTARSTEPLINDERDDPLKPLPGAEHEFEVENNKFAFTPGHLGKLFPKSNAAFHALGGLRGLEKGLRTDRHAGLSVDEKELEGTIDFKDVVGDQDKKNASESPRQATDPAQTDSAEAETAMKHEDAYADRLRIFGDNRLPDKKSKTIWQLMWLAFNDKMLILLSICAVVSLVLGIVQANVETGDNDPGRKLEWVEGVAIIAAVVIVVGVGAGNDWQKEKKFVALSKKKEDRVIKVIRSGKSREISVYDVVVGDVVHLDPGDIVPCDGVLIQGHGVKCDESSQTGESDIVKKLPGDDAYAAIEQTSADNHKIDPLIISGSKVQEGTGTFLCTGTGLNSSHGKIMMTLHEDSQTTPLQSKLNVMAEWIAKLGAGAGLLLFTVTFIEYLVNITHGSQMSLAPIDKGFAFVNILVTAITIIVVAVPEGLPLAVTLALAFATRKMMKENNLVRVFKACETMGNATSICSDKTGTLTQNKMTVVAGTFGLKSKSLASKRVESTKAIEVGNDDDNNSISAPGHKRSSSQDSTQSIESAVRSSSKEVKDVVKEAILINSSAFEGVVDGKNDFIGSKTEAALLGFARDELSMGPLDQERANLQVVQVEPFDSKRKCMATAIKLAEGGYRLHVKGASEIMLNHCKHIVGNAEDSMENTDLTEDDAETLRQTIDQYAERSLRTIGLIYRDFESWPPKGFPLKEGERDQVNFDKVLGDMTFLGLVGIQDPLRPGVAESVNICQKAGVTVRMVTGDNVLTAKSIAKDAGIFTEGGIVLEGPKFRQMTKKEMYEQIPQLQVLARSSPEDKRVLVKRLIELGETVAVTGDGTNDVPALKTADVGFAMGIAGTEVAKEASDIILLDDNFNSIVKAMMWGRCVNDAVKKFLQFQITVNITAVLLTFISAVSSTEQESVLGAVQLLWLNLIMDTFAALALATDPPTRAILDRKPERKDANLITFNMWKMIIGQTVYQLVITLVLYFVGINLPSVHGSVAELQGQQDVTDNDQGGGGELQLATLIFNTFVWMQIFNQYNSRRLDNKYNIFEGMFSNAWFLGIQVIMIGLQILIVFVGGAAFRIEPLNGTNWGISIGLGAGTMVWAIVLKAIPNSFIRRLTDPIARAIPDSIKRRVNKASAPEISVEDEEAQNTVVENYKWNADLEELKDELMFIKRFRGGRLRHLRWKLQHPREALAASRSPSRSRKGSTSEILTLPRTPNNEAVEDGTSPAPSTRPSLSPRRGRRSRSNSAFGPAAAMAGVVMGSIAGWSPVEVPPEDRLPSQNRNKGKTHEDAIEETSDKTGDDQKSTAHRHKASAASLAPPTAAQARSQRSNSNNTLSPPPIERE